MRSVVSHMPDALSATVTLATVESTTDTIASKVFCKGSGKLYMALNSSGASTGPCVLCRARYLKYVFLFLFFCFFALFLRISDSDSMECKSQKKREQQSLNVFQCERVHTYMNMGVPMSWSLIMVTAVEVKSKAVYRFGLH